MTRNRPNPDRDPHAPRRDRRRAIPEEPGSGPRPYQPTPEERAANRREAERVSEIMRALDDLLDAIEEESGQDVPPDVERQWRQVAFEMRGRRHPDDDCDLCRALRARQLVIRQNAEYS